MNTLNRIALISIASLAFSAGCARKPQVLIIETNPPDAVITVDGETLEDTSPARYPLEGIRKLYRIKMTVRAELEGYHANSKTITGEWLKDRANRGYDRHENKRAVYLKIHLAKSRDGED